MRITIALCICLLVFGLVLAACQTKTETVTSPDGTVTVTETSSLDQAALAAAMSALDHVTTLGLSIADRIAALELQRDAAEASGQTSIAAQISETIAALSPVLDYFSAEKAALTTEVARCRSVVDSGRGAWYVDPVTNTAKRNVEPKP